MTKKGRLRWLKPFGTALFAIAAVGYAATQYERIKNGWPVDPGYLLSHLCLALLGVSVMWVADCLRDLDSRVEELEKRNASTRP